MPTVRPTNALFFALMLVLLLTGCAPTAERPSLEQVMADAQEANAERAADGGHDHDHGPHDHGEDPDGEAPPSVNDQEIATAGSDTAAADAATTSPTAPGPAATPEPASSPEPGGPALEQHEDFPIAVSLDPLCVERGGEMTVTVDTGRDNTAVVYMAFYAGQETGAEPPYGDGHGGNDGDLADGDGRYQDSWVVSPSAPVGPARVEVMAGYHGENATGLARFEVVEAGSGECDR